MANSDTNDPEHTKRLIKLISGVLVVIAAVLGVIFWLSSGDEDATPEIKSNVSVTEQEKLAAKSVAEEFVKSSGNFGVRTDQLTGDNIRNVSYLIEKGEASVKDYLLSRQDSYNFVKDNYVFSGSPIDYDTREMAQWKNNFESSRMATMAVQDVSGIPNDNGQYLTVNGSDTRGIEVQVTFNSKETIRDVTANDTSWDGSYAVLEKTFANNTVTLLLAESEEGWKVYSQKDLDNQFLLSSWKTPNSDAYSDRQTSFTRVDTLNLSEPLKEP